jgi:hypothetical protein
MCNRVVKECGRCTAWGDDTCKDGYAMAVDTHDMSSTAGVVLRVPGVAGRVSFYVGLDHAVRDITMRAECGSHVFDILLAGDRWV